MKKSISRAAVVALTMGGLIAGTAPAAMAAQGTRPCPSYYYCFYEDKDYNGYNGTDSFRNHWFLQYQSTTFGHFADSPVKDVDGLDELSSIINNTGKRICVYDARGGQHRVIVNVDPYEDFRSIGSANERADYWRAVTTATCP